MSYCNYMEIVIQLEAITEIVNQTLWYIYQPEMINDVDELCTSVQSIPEMITEIKEILEKELMKYEGYSESQN